ncbi:MAG TPA: glycosyl hydrolase family 28 protein [Phnomibacter sp.]|nr:glycosyl hydrolase family 28 protein [Phnomibacter sp.]
MNTKNSRRLSWVILCTCLLSLHAVGQELFPDGTPIPEWFRKNEATDIRTLGTQYILTKHGVKADSNLVQTEKIQAVIDKAAKAGGGVIVVPKGTFLSGSIFFKPKTHLYIEAGGKLKGSDDISNFPIVMTRIEGQTLKYFAALVNADNLDGFTISGKGTIDGNGLRYWKAFWLRREFNPKCTNMDEMRPRLLYVSNSKNVQVSGVRLINSPFWTSHYYNCENVKLLNLYIYSPDKPVKAPSTDAVDIDGCKNVLVKNCYMSVNDDAVALKGGKGPTADKDANNGANINIIIEDCTYGFCHGALTFGSESIHDRNIIMRRIKINHAQRVLWFKFRPDTPQNYEYVLLEDIEGHDIANFVFIKPWTQFFDLKGETNVRTSTGRNVTLRNIKLDCDNAFAIESSKPQAGVLSFDYQLSDFTLENLDIKAHKDAKLNTSAIKNCRLKNVSINGEKFNN